LKIFFPQFFWFPKFFPQQKSLEQRIFRVKIRSEGIRKNDDIFKIYLDISDI